MTRNDNCQIWWPFLSNSLVLPPNHHLPNSSNPHRNQWLPGETDTLLSPKSLLPQSRRRRCTARSRRNCLLIRPLRTLQSGLEEFLALGIHQTRVSLSLGRFLHHGWDRSSSCFLCSAPFITTPKHSLWSKRLTCIVSYEPDFAVFMEHHRNDDHWLARNAVLLAGTTDILHFFHI